MTKQVKVFLSSTWQDLEEHRRILIDNLHQLKARVEAMEFFGASPETPLKESLRRLRSSDLYVGILGTRYGTIDKSSGKSITELEYDEATKLNMPVLMYLIAEDKHPVLPKYVETGTGASELTRFKEKVKQNHTCEFFSSPDNLCRKVITNLINYLEEKGNEATISLPISTNPRRFFTANIPPESDLPIDDNLISLDRILNHMLFETEGLSKIKEIDENLEAELAAVIIAYNIQKGNYDVLKYSISFSPGMLNRLIAVLKEIGFDEDLFASSILWCSDSFQLRQLIKLAGQLGVSACTENICIRLLYSGKKHHGTIQRSGLTVTPFNNVVKDSLGLMPIATQPIIENYLEKARQRNNWQAKRVFENVLKNQNKRAKIGIR